MPNSKLVNQLFSAIETGNVDQFNIALAIGLAQQPPIDLNQIYQNVLHYNPAFITHLLNECSIKIYQVNAFNKSVFDFAVDCNLDVQLLESAFTTNGTNSQKLTTSVYHRHISRHKCLACFYTTTDLSNFYKHQRCHTNTRPNKCSKCPYSTNDSCNLLKHERSHSLTKPYKCRQCDYSTHNKQSLQQHHERHHSGKRPYKCASCDETFILSRALLEHKRKHHKKVVIKKDRRRGPKKYIIEDVNDLLKAKRPRTAKVIESDSDPAQEANKPKTHLAQNRTVQKEYTCVECAYSTGFYKMIIHMRKHTGERPYKCKQCDFAAPRNYDLLRHVRCVHEKHAKFKCPVCDYTTYRSDHLTTHIRTHTGERPYGCHECKMAFARSDELKRHAKVHRRMKSKNRKTKLKRTAKVINSDSDMSDDET